MSESWRNVVGRVSGAVLVVGALALQATVGLEPPRANNTSYKNPRPNITPRQLLDTNDNIQDPTLTITLIH